MRMRKYEDYFVECNRKLIQTDYAIKMSEKRIKEEMQALTGSKNILKDRIGTVEGEISTMVSHTI